MPQIEVWQVWPSKYIVEKVEVSDYELDSKLDELDDSYDNEFFEVVVINNDKG